MSSWWFDWVVDGCAPCVLQPGIVNRSASSPHVYLSTLCVLVGGCFLSCTRASLSVFSSGLTALLPDVCVFVLSLRWLRVMVTRKVLVCCNSILSSSDTLMKGHHTNAWRKPARNLQKGTRIDFRMLSPEEFVCVCEYIFYLWFRQQ